MTIVQAMRITLGAAAAGATLIVLGGTFGAAQLAGQSQPNELTHRSTPIVVARWIGEPSTVTPAPARQSAEPAPATPIQAPGPLVPKESATPGTVAAAAPSAPDPATTLPEDAPTPDAPEPGPTETTDPALVDPYADTYTAPGPGMCAVNQRGYGHPDAEPCTDSDGIHCPEGVGPDADHPEYLENGELDPEWVKATEGEEPDGC